MSKTFADIIYDGYMSPSKLSEIQLATQINTHEIMMKDPEMSIGEINDAAYNKYLYEEAYSNIIKENNTVSITLLNEGDNNIRYCYFMPEEIEGLIGYYCEDAEDAMIIDTIEHDTHSEKLADLQQELKDTNDPDEIARIKQTMVNMGWNPEVDFSFENCVLARERIEFLENQYFKTRGMILNIEDAVNDNCYYTKIAESNGFGTIILSISSDGKEAKLGINEYKPASEYDEVYALNIEAAKIPDIEKSKTFNNPVLYNPPYGCTNNLKVMRLFENLILECYPYASIKEVTYSKYMTIYLLNKNYMTDSNLINEYANYISHSDRINTNPSVYGCYLYHHPKIFI